jgi:hypothetical protein
LTAISTSQRNASSAASSLVNLVERLFRPIGNGDFRARLVRRRSAFVPAADAARGGSSPSASGAVIVAAFAAVSGAVVVAAVAAVIVAALLGRE